MLLLDNSFPVEPSSKEVAPSGSAIIEKHRRDSGDEKEKRENTDCDFHFRGLSRHGAYMLFTVPTSTVLRLLRMF